MSAPISRERPIRLAAAARKKHQASAETRMSSGAFCTVRNRNGSAYLARAKPATTSTAPRHSDPSSGTRLGLRMFGWTASIATAQRSWMTSTPSVIRPGSVSSSNLSFRILTTTSVLDRHMQRPGEEHRRAARRHLAQVDLEADDEQEQDQPDLGDGADALVVGDPAESDVRADDHARRQVGDDQRLLEAPGDRGDERGRADAYADAGEQVGWYVHRCRTPRSSSMS